MSDHSAIEWTEATWNPVTGCTKVSPGCDHCYAERITERFHGKGSFAVVQRSEEKLYLPLKWRKPRRVFVNSMSDLFHDDVPAPFIGRVFAVMARTPQHTYQILTKRHGRMRALLSSPTFVHDCVRRAAGDTPMPWPLPNVWLGVSVEDQHWADVRIPALLATPAVVRWLSCEPLLGPVDIEPWLHTPECLWQQRSTCTCEPGGLRLDWIVVGGESGLSARPMYPDWARSLRDQTRNANARFFLKQWGGRTPKANGRELDGRTWDEYPAVREAAPA